MSTLLNTSMEFAIVLLNAMALVVVVFGAVRMFVTCMLTWASRASTQLRLRDAYAQFGRWLIAGLTFQLAADIVGSMLTPDWPAIGRLAAIAAVRTFLNYFLEKDLLEIAGKVGHRSETAKHLNPT